MRRSDAQTGDNANHGTRSRPDYFNHYFFLFLWASPAEWQGGSCPPVPYAPRLPPSRREKKLYVPSRPFPSIVAA